MDLSMERWNSVASNERAAIAKQLARELPDGFTFHGVLPFELGQSRNEVAIFRYLDAKFALVPGGTVSLGYEFDRAFEPNPDEMESWQETNEEYEINQSLHEYVQTITRRVHRANLPPLLIETKAGELGWEPVDPRDPDVRDLVKEYGHEKEVTVRSAKKSVRIRGGSNGVSSIERSIARTHADFAHLLANEGFRFPTSDEWEYACGAGARTLFRWGDHVPCDRYPIDTDVDGPDWEFHRQPNAFGLFIASDPYQSELVAEIGTTRGGDGGATICGGAGFYVGWLTLATAYFDSDTCQHVEDELVNDGYTIGRRVLELS